jgi:hypothetical protein
MGEILQDALVVEKPSWNFLQSTTSMVAKEQDIRVALEDGDSTTGLKSMISQMDIEYFVTTVIAAKLEQRFAHMQN